MKLARGLKIVRSQPRSLMRRSWFASIDSRSSSSLISSSATLGAWAGSLMPAICRLRHASSALGAVWKCPEQSAIMRASGRTYRARRYRGLYGPWPGERPPEMIIFQKAGQSGSNAAYGTGGLRRERSDRIPSRLLGELEIIEVDSEPPAQSSAD